MTEVDEWLAGWDFSVQVEVQALLLFGNIFDKLSCFCNRIQLLLTESLKSGNLVMFQNKCRCY